MMKVFVLIDFPNLDYLFVPVIEELNSRRITTQVCVYNDGHTSLLDRKQIPYTTQVTAFADFLQTDGPRLFLNASDMNYPAHRLGWRMDDACRRNGVPSLSVEHAAHSLYPIDKKDYMVNADRLALSGRAEFDAYQKLGVPADRLAVTGCPKYDQYFHLMRQACLARRDSDCWPCKPGPYLLLAGVNNTFALPYTGGWSEEEWTWVLRNIFTVLDEKYPHLRIVVKPHPSEPAHDLVKLYAQAAPPEKASKIDIIDAHAYLPEVILGSEFVFSFSPSVVLESLLLQTPVIDLVPHGVGGIRQNLHQCGAIPIHLQWKEVSDALRTQLPGEISRGSTAIRLSEELLEQTVYRWDGKAAHRIADLIEHMISDRYGIKLTGASVDLTQSPPQDPNPSANKQLSSLLDQASNIVLSDRPASSKVARFATNADASLEAVSIIIVTFNSEHHIGACLDSVVRTLRPQDGIIVVDNGSKDATIENVRNFTARHSRIRLIENSRNLGYSAAINIGASASASPFLVLLNPDTQVTAHWLERLQFHFLTTGVAAVGPVTNYVAGAQKVASYLSREMGKAESLDDFAHRLYQLNRGKSIDTLLLIGFCMMIRTTAWDLLGGLDEDLFLGNDDLDISLRLREKGFQLKIATDTFIYHKGQASFQTVTNTITDQLVQESTDLLYMKLNQRYGPGKVPSSMALWGMNWFKPGCRFQSVTPLTSIIILTLNQLDYTRKCIDSLLRNTGNPFELIVVDNGSSDGTPSYLKSIQRAGTACVRIHIIENESNAGFSRGNNQGLTQAKGRYVVFLNNDVMVSDGWLAKLIRTANLNSAIGLAGPVTNRAAGRQKIDTIAYDDDRPEDFEAFAQRWASTHKEQVEACWRLVGFCLLAKREVIDAIGGFEERYGTGNFEDDDFCIRANLAGFRGVIAKDCFVHHFGGRTFKALGVDYAHQMRSNWQLFKQRWGIAEDIAPDGTYTIPKGLHQFDPGKHRILL